MSHKPKHTPGPWRTSSDGISVYSPGGRLVCHAVPRRVLAQQAANAELIAAAPELLEALETVRKWLGPQTATIEGVPIIQQIDAVLLKVKSETP